MEQELALEEFDAKYSEDCRSLMFNIRRAKLIGIISSF